MTTQKVTPTAEPIGFIVACKDFFGFLPGQTLLTFKEEVAKLTPADKAEMHAGLVALGYNLKPL